MRGSKVRSDELNKLVSDLSALQLRDALDRNPNLIKEQDERGWTLLHHAAVIEFRRGLGCRTDEIVELLQVLFATPGIDFSIQNKDGETALHAAVDCALNPISYNYVFPMFVEAAVKQGFDFSTQEQKNGRTVLQCAVMTAVEAGKKVAEKNVKTLLEKAPSPGLNSLSALGATALFYAIYFSSWKVAQILVDAGADPTLFSIASDETTVQYVRGEGLWRSHPLEYKTTSPIACLETQFTNLTESYRQADSTEERAEIQVHLDAINTLRKHPGINSYAEPSGPPYALNPHRHYKIWLSSDRESFLNPENQLRLVKMCDKNPKDAIHFVYAKQLLSEAALVKLHAFCKRHTIIPLAVEEDILPHCSQNQSEQNLITIYKQEIAASGEGGNLASASDILRWLTPMHQYGIYADFDIEINTQALPERIMLLQPIIFNIGSIEIDKTGLESIYFNNDVIAVVVQDAVTKQLIQHLQEQIFLAHQGHLSYTEFDDRTIDALSQVIPKKETEAFVKSQSHYATTSKLERNRTDAISMRLKIKEQESQVDLLALSRELADWQGIDRSPEEIKDIAVKILLSMATQPLLSMLRSVENQGADVVLKTWKRMTDFIPAYKETVTMTTGPGRLCLSLLPSVILSVWEINQQVAPYSLEHYGLNNSFCSKQALSLHSDAITANVVFSGSFGERSDMSWVQEGVAKVKEREITQEKAAKTIQRFFRTHQSKENPPVDKSSSENLPPRTPKK